MTPYTLLPTAQRISLAEKKNKSSLHSPERFNEKDPNKLPNFRVVNKGKQINEAMKLKFKKQNQVSSFEAK
jgi:hypothetical protein